MTSKEVQCRAIVRVVRVRFTLSSIDPWAAFEPERMFSEYAVNTGNGWRRPRNGQDLCDVRNWAIDNGYVHTTVATSERKTDRRWRCTYTVSFKMAG